MNTKVECTIAAPIETIWKLWTEPQHMIKWWYISDHWNIINVENDLRTGGQFKISMIAKKGDTSFDFEGLYTHVEEYKEIEYCINKRKIKIMFSENGNATIITKVFEEGKLQSFEDQKNGWEMMLDNFKKYVKAVNSKKISSTILFDWTELLIPVF